MRHMVNPAFQPVSDGYVNFTPVGHTTLWLGNNSVTMNDVLTPVDGESSFERANPEDILEDIKQVTLLGVDGTLGLFNFGFRHKEKGYIHIGVNERIECAVGLTKDFFELALEGGLANFKDTKKLQLDKCAVRLCAYTEFSGGYSYQLNDKWAVGGKIKFLIGQANLTLRYRDLSIDISPDKHHIYGIGNLQCAVPFNFKTIEKPITYDHIANSAPKDYLEDVTWKDYLTPRGFGAGLDIGFTYKPHPQVQITAAINDLGFITWNGTDYRILVDSAFSGNLSEKDVEELTNNATESVSACEFGNNLVSSLQDMVRNMYSTNVTYTFTYMLSTVLNVGVDANFCKNKLGLGVVSKTQYYAGRWYEEVTIGGAVRPCNWFNFALSYSLINNGKYSNFGAGLSIMPYDGVNLTLAMDYIPTSYIKYNNVAIPDKCKGMNVALGLNIVWGTNKHKVKTKKVG